MGIFKVTRSVASKAPSIFVCCHFDCLSRSGMAYRFSNCCCLMGVSIISAQLFQYKVECFYLSDDLEHPQCELPVFYLTSMPFRKG